jgi:hypothetical protein
MKLAAMLLVVLAAWSRPASALPSETAARDLALADARLDHAAALDGALDRPARLARLCLDAQLACGFELRPGVWKRPESRRRVPSATIGQALKGFMGKDYVLAWRDGVLLMTPASPEAGVRSDANFSGIASSRTLRAASLRAGFGLSVTGKPPRSPELGRPNSWIAVHALGRRPGKLFWYWGEVPSRRP